jgi:hypothetical protein
MSQRASMVTSVICIAWAGAVWARDPGDPIHLAWIEGDVAGMTRIYADGQRQPIGSVEYHQHRSGDVLTAVRIAHFTDGSGDEDEAEAKIGATLEAVRGRSILRNAKGTVTLELTIDVAARHVGGFSGVGKERQEYDESLELTAGTYWGPLIAMVIKNFDANATGDKLVFRSVVATPKPRVLDMEITRGSVSAIAFPGGRVRATEYTMLPTVNFLLDPFIKRLAPKTTFFEQDGKPPALVRYAGPRNYQGQMIRIE